MSIYYVGKSFNPTTANPYDNNRPYTDDWIILKMVDSKSYMGKGGNGKILRFVIAKERIGWEYRIFDFIQYESSHNKNIIVAIDENDLKTAQSVYGNHSYTDNFLRTHEHKILIHTTTKENYISIMKDGYLKSWNLLKKLGVLAEDKPIGNLLGDQPDYSDYIMFTNDGSINAEIVVSSRQKGKINEDFDTSYIAGARFYFDADKIAQNGLLVRDGLNLKVKDSLQIDKYILWIATPDVLGISEETTPRIFYEKANAMFEQKFGIILL